MRRLVVDWQACRARGVCSELLPERISLDEWGYPLIEPQIEPGLWPAAREAVAGCPRMALRLLAADGRP